MDTWPILAEVNVLPYDPKQREGFRSGQLREKWARKHGDIFDEDDLRLARSQPRYHFFEWLAAVRLYQQFGCLSLVEQYQFASHREKGDRMWRLGLSDDLCHFMRNHEADFGKVQCPDLLVRSFQAI